MEKYGFVYIWFDRKHKRYYIGSHWGREDDGYICSSKWMKDSYKRRSNDFKRRIITTNILTRDELANKEHYWLSKISSNELGCRYYNLKNHRFGHWSAKDDADVVRQKIANNEVRKEKIRVKAIGRGHSEETKEKIRQRILGTTLSEEHKANISNGHNRIYDQDFADKISKAAKNRSEQTRKKISVNASKLQAEGKIGMKGRKHSEETKAKMAAIRRAHYSNK